MDHSNSLPVDVDQRVKAFMQSCLEAGIDRAQLLASMRAAALAEKPPVGLLMSMAIRVDHALGIRGYYDNELFRRAGASSHKERIRAGLRQAQQLYREISGRGFYHADREQSYEQIVRDAGIAVDHPDFDRVRT